MKTPEIPKNELERLQALEAYQILDTLPEREFDSITEIASYICQTPISLVSLIDKDRQWFKSHRGLDATETPRDHAFCAHAINHPEAPFIVEDSSKDERFADNPMVTGDPNVRFYVGAPLVTSESLAIGTLCVIDHEPRKLNEAQLTALRSLADQVIAQLEFRKKVQELEQLKMALLEKNHETERFAHLISHDLKSPLRSMVTLSEMIFEESKGKLNESAEMGLVHLKSKAEHAYKLVQGILNHSISGVEAIQPERVDLETFIDELIRFCSPPSDIHVIADVQISEAHLDPTLLHQILQNLISNAIKYNDKSEGLIYVRVYRDQGQIIIEVQDNGPGIPKEQKDKIFVMFQTLHRQDRFGVKGTGIGLNTVKKLTEVLKGTVEVVEEVDEGATFRIRLPLA
jgi:signal transduction histidine kinase